MSIKRIIHRTLPLPQLPGSELRLVELQWSPGYEVPAHTHPVNGLGLVIEGSLVSQYEGEELEVFNEGDIFQDKVGILHPLAKNPSPDGPLRVILSYVVKTGQATTVIV